MAWRVSVARINDMKANRVVVRALGRPWSRPAIFHRERHFEPQYEAPRKSKVDEAEPAQTLQRCDARPRA
jgi:hypothetical protein